MPENFHLDLANWRGLRNQLLDVVFTTRVPFELFQQLTNLPMSLGQGCQVGRHTLFGFDIDATAGQAETSDNFRVSTLQN